MDGRLYLAAGSSPRCGERPGREVFLFANAQKGAADGQLTTPVVLTLTPEQYNTPVEKLELSSRTLNCLKRASIDKVGQVLEMNKSELLPDQKLRREVAERALRAAAHLRPLPPELDPDLQEAQEEASEAEEAETADTES